MTILTVINQNITATNTFLKSILNYKAINKIIVINYLLSEEEQKENLTSHKIIHINCNENKGYSYALNLGLKYISEHFKNSNIIISNNSIKVSEATINSLLKKLKHKDIGIVSPNIFVLNNKMKCNKKLNLLQFLKLQMPFKYKKEVQKESNIIFFDDDYYQNDISYVYYSSLLFAVTKEQTMRKINYLDDKIYISYEEAILAEKMLQYDYRWAISNKDTVYSTQDSKFDLAPNIKSDNSVSNKSLRYYLKKYLTHNFLDKIIYVLICIIMFIKGKLSYMYVKLLIWIDKVKYLIPALFKMWKMYHFSLSLKEAKKIISNLASSIRHNVVWPKDVIGYHNWIIKNEIPFVPEQVHRYQPTFSFIINCSKNDTAVDWLMNSLLRQTYKKFEIIFIDEYFNKYKNKDARIKIYKDNSKNNVIDNNIIKQCDGEYLIFLQSNMTLNPDALLYMVDLLNKEEQVDLIYADSDQIDHKKNRINPVFKSDWAPDTFLSYNYIGDFFAIKKEIFNLVKGYRNNFGSFSNYDLLLRVTELTPNIFHVSKILCHYQQNSNRVANDIEKGQKALEDTLKRRKIMGKVEVVDNEGLFNIQYDLGKDNDLVSILLPTRDHVEYLKLCIESIYEKTTYKNFEIIIIDHDTVQPDALQYLNEIEKRYNNIRIIKKHGEFNYSNFNNSAAKIAKGKYFVLMNSDIKIITPNWIELMLGYAKQSHIGCVGAKLYYPDKTVQHGGVIIGMGGIASHAFIGKSDEEDYCHRLKVVHNYSAVTFACIMVNRDKYFEIGGLNEDLKCAFNDVDFCLRMLNHGYYNVFLPQVTMYHYESKIRGLDNKGWKLQRFTGEKNYMKNKWHTDTVNDKFYNCNLSKAVAFYIGK